MNLSSLKKFLETAKHLTIQLPNGSLVPAHFHITEIGLLSKHFIDCGGTVREEKVATLQLWTADDVEIIDRQTNAVFHVIEKERGLKFIVNRSGLLFEGSNFRNELFRMNVL